MKKNTLVTVCGLTALTLAGCALPTGGPVMNENRKVTPLAAAALETDALVLNRTSTWHSPDRQHEVVLQPGIYPLEAEDAQYRYYGSPGAVVFRVEEQQPSQPLNFDFRFGDSDPAEEASDRKMITMSEPGGIFLARDGNIAGAYMSASPDQKLLAFQLPQAFLAQQGTTWRRGLDTLATAAPVRRLPSSPRVNLPSSAPGDLSDERPQNINEDVDDGALRQILPPLPEPE